MAKVTFIATFRVEDNELIKSEFRDSVKCEPLRYLKEVPDTTDLYDSDAEFKKLYQEYKQVKDKYYKYIDDKLSE